MATTPGHSKAARYAAKHEKLGLCRRCPQPVMDGWKLCEKHLSVDKAMDAAYSANYRNNHYVRHWLNIIRGRAAGKGLPFDLTEADISIPTHCPVLGIPLVTGLGRGLRSNAPSLDRFIPELGYVRGNVEIISYRANVLKSNATLEEHEKLTAWMRWQTEKRKH